MRGLHFFLTLAYDSEPKRDEMVSCEIGRRTIVKRDRFQKAQSLAKGPCAGSGCSPGRRSDPGTEAGVASESDHQSRDVSADEHSRGLRSAKCPRVLPLSTNRPQFDVGAGIPPSRRSRSGSRPRFGFFNPHQPSDRSQEDALRTLSLSRVSFGGQQGEFRQAQRLRLDWFIPLATRTSASVPSHLCRSRLKLTTTSP